VIHSFLLTFFHFCCFSSSHDWLVNIFLGLDLVLLWLGFTFATYFSHHKEFIESISVCSTPLAFWRAVTKASERLAEDGSDNGAGRSSKVSLCGGFEAAT
jgi:uncharacterized membrane protein